MCQPAIVFIQRYLLFVQQRDTFHLAFAFQQGIQEIKQQVLVDFLTEDALEAHIGKGIDEL